MGSIVRTVACFICKPIRAMSSLSSSLRASSSFSSTIVVLGNQRNSAAAAATLIRSSSSLSRDIGLVAFPKCRSFSTLQKSTSMFTNQSSGILSLKTPTFVAVSGQAVVHRSFSSASSTSAPSEEEPSNLETKYEAPSKGQRAMGIWLAVCSAMIFVMVVLGGITRLTKSGLSMSYWKPVSVLPPITQEEWEAEFEIYKQYPEYKIKNQGMSLEEFKFIFYMEWFHRVWGRAIGVVFAVPLAYFVVKKIADARMAKMLATIFVLGGAQGALGWYMVKSGLHLQEGDKPRVSPYRLCAHLLAAFTLYEVLIWNSFTLLRGYAPLQAPKHILAELRPLRQLASAVIVLTSLTVISGAFMAGNEAGHAYPEWPTMSGQFIPDQIWEQSLGWRNLFENIPTVHFDHRMLAYATLFSILVLGFRCRKRGALLPPQTKAAATGLMHMSLLQVGLGITTVLTSVPVSIAALHQAGSLILLTIATFMLHTLRIAARSSAKIISKAK